MRKMKRFVSAVIMAAMVGTLCLTGCGSDKSAEGSTGSKSGKQVTVAVVQPMSHTSLIRFVIRLLLNLEKMRILK